MGNLECIDCDKYIFCEFSYPERSSCNNFTNTPAVDSEVREQMTDEKCIRCQKGLHPAKDVREFYKPYCFHCFNKIRNEKKSRRRENI